MPTIETNEGAIFARVPAWKVSTADSLLGPFTEVSFLYVDALRLSAGPDVDVCHLSWIFGEIIQAGETTPATYTPQDLQNKFVKVEMIQKHANGTLHTSSQYNLTWYGIIEQDQFRADGSSAEIAKGQQLIYAFGLNRLLERTRIETSRVGDNTDDFTLKRGLVFNRSYAGQIPITRNRAKESSGNDPLSKPNYMFAEVPAELQLLSEQTDVWTAQQAVRYILSFHSPRDKDGNPPFDWVLDDPNDALDYVIPPIDTDLKSPKEIIDRIIDRRRGLGYTVEFDADNSYVKIIPFTFTDTPITLPSGATLPANTNTNDLNFELSLDVQNPTIRDIVADEYHTIRVLGERETVTFTASFDPNNTPPQIVPAWYSDAETDYLDELGSAADDIGAILKRNSIQNSEVFRTFRINPDWDGSDGTYQILSPILNEDGENDETSTDMEPIYQPESRLMPDLGLPEGVDLSGAAIENELSGLTVDKERTKWMKPFFLFTDSGGGIWHNLTLFLDKLSETAIYQKEGGRNWSVGSKMMPHGLEFELDVVGGPQYFLAATDVAGIDAPDAQNPDVNHAIDWGDIFGTLCIELDRRLSAEETIEEPVAGELERVLTLHVPGAGRDYVAPETTVGVKIETNPAYDATDDDSAPVTTEIQRSNGGYVRDDLEKLKEVAKLAAEWYGKPRRSISMEIRNIINVIQPGMLITNIGETYNKTGINTIVSAVEYFPQRQGDRVPHQRFETSYYDLDFRS